MRALMRGEHASDLPVPTRLAADVPRPGPLFLGVLLHDIGKGRGRDHSTVGAEMIPEIGQRLGLAANDMAHVRWLVQEHLSLYHWAMRRDTSDPEAIAEVARRVGTLDRLRDLYVLTVADLSTTNPNAMTSWKARMLDELYLATASVLENGLDSGGERANAIRDEARVGFVGDGGEAELESFLLAMPDRYVLANPVDVIRAHARIARDRNGRELLISLRPGPSEDVTELVIVTDDRPGLLADVAAALAASRLDVTTAQIHTRLRGTPPDARSEAFDIFHVRRAGPALGGAIDPGVWPRFEEDLEALLHGRTSADALLGKRLSVPPSWARRHSPAVKTEILVDQDVSPHFTVIDVFTRDRVGLLHAIARTFHEQGLSIALSKVTTEGERAADVFYVTDAGGGQLRDPARVTALSTSLREAIEKLRENS
jgi:[protein-PII] uridylyltransferase